VCPLSIAFMTSSSWWSIHLPHSDALGCLLVLAEFCIVVVVGWHCYYVIGCKCWFTCVVRVVGWGCQFFWSSQSILETSLCCFLHTLRHVGRQFANGAPLVCGYKVSFCISKFILVLLFLGPISKHLEVSTQVLQEVQIHVLCMKTKKSKNSLDLDSV
jgi:hypothetical protein